MDKLCGIKSIKNYAINSTSGKYKIYKYDNLPQFPLDLSSYTSGNYFRKKGKLDILLLSVTLPGDDKEISSVLAKLYEQVDIKPELISHGQHTESFGPLYPHSNLSSFYFKIPSMYMDDEVEDKYLQAVPISDNERKYLLKFGVEALDDYFEYHSVDIFFLWRHDSMEGFDDNAMQNAQQEVALQNARIINGDYDEIFRYINSLGDFDINVFFDHKSYKTYTCDAYTKFFPHDFAFNGMMISNTEADLEQEANLFATASSCFWTYPELFRHGSVLQVNRSPYPDSEIEGFYVTHPNMFKEVEILKKYLWIIPVTVAEIDYLYEYGSDALEVKLWTYNGNLFDFKRKSSV